MADCADVESTTRIARLAVLRRSVDIVDTTTESSSLVSTIRAVLSTTNIADLLPDAILDYVVRDVDMKYNERVVDIVAGARNIVLTDYAPEVTMEFIN